MIKGAVLFVIGLTMTGVTACTASRAPYPPPSPSFSRLLIETENKEIDSYWWRCRFQIKWPPDRPPEMAADLMIAHGVVRPILRQHGEKIQLWRFHRRAARDKTGHQFSFLFYTDTGSAADILREIQTSPMLAQALEAGIIQKVLADDPDEPSHPEVHATSDKGWSPEMQRNWPLFIMGASAAWLGLIEDVLNDDLHPAEDDPDALMEPYRTAQKKITSIWYQEGQHAFLHHLNALFGYQPLRVQKDIQF